jgi:predicted phage-related endonuclease
MQMTYIEDESNDKPDTELVPSSLNAGRLDITNYPLEIVVQNIDQFVNEDYALLRKNGLGTSDSSALLGVNPFTSREDLIAEKVRNYITEEEKGIGDLTNVRKGRDLEPLIIQKYEKYMGSTIIKPIDMYRHK